MSERHPYLDRVRSWPLSADEVANLPDPPVEEAERPAHEHGAVVWQEDAAVALRDLLRLV